MKTYKVSKPPRLRFAPSPTGQLHLGGLRTALFNHLFARRYNGQWILRIEDTDQTRIVPGAVETLQENLAWAGLDYDEGPSVGGSRGPYVQSERLELYKSHAERLISLGRAYRDFRPQSNDAPKGKKGRGIRVVDKYVPPDEDEARRLIRDGKAYVVRLKTQPKETRFDDLVFGGVTFQPDGSNDPILLKSDGWPTYHLANVVDDHEMGITHVLRGEEWLPSVPKHLDIYSALSFEPPTFVHLPLLVAKGGAKLSKRSGDVHIDAYRQAGYEPEALINFIALMGYNHRIERTGEEIQKLSEGEAVYEVKSMQELIDEFDPLQISPSRSALSPHKLAFLNRRHVAMKVEQSPEEACAKVQPDLTRLYGEIAPTLVQDAQYVRRVVELLSGRVDVLDDLPSEAAYFFQDPDWDEKAAAKQGKKVVEQPDFTFILDEARTALQANDADVADTTRSTGIITDIARKLGDQSGESDDGGEETALSKHLTSVKKALRFALSGGKPGPDIESIMSVLGRDVVLQRLEQVLRLHGEHGWGSDATRGEGNSR